MNIKELKETLHFMEMTIDYADQISKLPDCNTCIKQTICPHKPYPGEFVRINCFEYLGGESNESTNCKETEIGKLEMPDSD